MVRIVARGVAGADDLRQTTEVLEALLVDIYQGKRVNPGLI
jgi:hypothetical protein